MLWGVNWHCQMNNGKCDVKGKTPCHPQEKDFQRRIAVMESNYKHGFCDGQNAPLHFSSLSLNKLAFKQSRNAFWDSRCQPWPVSVSESSHQQKLVASCHQALRRIERRQTPRVCFERREWSLPPRWSTPTSPVDLPISAGSGSPRVVQHPKRRVIESR